MKATDMLNKVKEVLGVELTEETQEVKLAQATLENGTVIESENFAAGSEVFIVTEDEKVALPVGEYTLEDGEMLKVEEEGVIASIGKAEEPAEEASKEENLEEDKEEMRYATKEELAEVKEMIEEIKGMIEHKDKMSAEEPESETKEELSAVEQPVEKIKHNPEKETKKAMHLYGQKRPQTTYDRVLSKIANLKNN
jgi:hypothetical protein|tara:strand:- start:1258 stop:1845 length:588 start_codon:yes stop_codon:yes gene_type:complete